MTRFLLTSAVVGAVLWIALVGTAFLGGVTLTVNQALVVLAPLVAIPVGFSLVPEPSRLLRGAFEMQPFAALPAAASFLLDPGPLAGTLVTPWFVLTGWAALAGLFRLRRALSEGLPSVLVAAGLLFLPVAGSMMVFDRIGVTLLGFSAVIILLTAAHFHFTGFVTPLLAAFAGRKADSQFSRTLFRFTGVTLIVAPPLVAAGFVFSPLLQVSSVIGLVLGVWGLAALQARVLSRLRRPAARDLLTISTLSIALGMALAAAYSIGEYFETWWLDIPTMGWTHGILNGVGFALCGLLAWTVESRPGAVPSPHRPRTSSAGSRKTEGIMKDASGSRGSGIAGFREARG